jgi:hypothetical protein
MFLALPESGSISQTYESGFGCGSGSIHPHAKTVKKNLESYNFVIVFDSLSPKNDANVPSKNNKEKILLKK